MVFSHFGEGEYEKSEMIIQGLLGINDTAVSSSIPSTRATTKQRTAETYLGYQRAKYFVSPEAGPRTEETIYSIPEDLASGQWGLEGRWIQNAKDVESQGPGALEILFRAEKIYLVMEPVEGETYSEIRVTVNGEPANTPDMVDGKFICDESRLYQLFDQREAVEGIIRIETSGPVRFFAFTFG
ncbi:MAG: hypothetical protein JXR70_05295 [Spirochaetales bacterium]|nr:hypothetical protein [Spirochaetales bacterium]